jgi:hypothetical protein
VTHTAAQEKSGLPVGKPASNDLLANNYLAGITGTGAGSGEEPHEPHEDVSARPAAAAASAITLTNFIVLFGFY